MAADLDDWTKELEVELAMLAFDMWATPQSVTEPDQDRPSTSRSVRCSRSRPISLLLRRRSVTVRNPESGATSRRFAFAMIFRNLGSLRTVLQGLDMPVIQNAAAQLGDGCCLADWASVLLQDGMGGGALNGVFQNDTFNRRPSWWCLRLGYVSAGQEETE
jgi:hypothetical protein